MDTSDTAIVFDEFGICDHCRTFDREILPTWNMGYGREAELGKIVADIKIEGKGNRNIKRG